jgi:hypothetical protein
MLRAGLGSNWVRDPKGATMPRTGAKNTVAGIYKCDSCGERITEPLGHEFPDCPKCKKAVNWTLVVATKK